MRYLPYIYAVKTRNTMPPKTGIPTVDLSEFVPEDPKGKLRFARTLGQAFEEVGFVSVVHPGIDPRLIQRLYRQVKAFFELPGPVKQSYEIPGLAGQRGYTSFGKEHAKGSDTPDLKEFFQFGQTPEPGLPAPEPYPGNVEVRELPDFLPTLFETYRAFEKAGQRLLGAIALYLGLEESYFDAHIRQGNSILRAIHYPPIVTEPHSAIRAEQHEDINLITLLVGASAEGLEVLDKSGSWIPVVSRGEEIVVNVGDMLQRLTNNRLKSTTHRVVNPPREKWHQPRYSIPFFLHPVSAMDLSCLKNCVDESHPLNYPPITAGAYLDERLREIGLKK